MRITILSPYYPPEMGAPPARLSELAVRLQAFGHAVSVVTAFPNRPQGKIYPGYRGRFRMLEEIEGVRVIRTWIRPSAASASFLGRTVNDMSFTLSSGWTTAGLLGRQDVLLVQNPPLFSAFSARHLKRKTGAKLVMWCGDIWPDILLQSGQLAPGLLERGLRRLQQYGFNGSDLLAVTNPAIARETQARYKCPPVTVWSNGVDTKLFSPEKRSAELRNELGVGPDDVLVGYVGLHGRFQGLAAVVEAAALLKNRPEFKFVFVGEGVEKARLKNKAQALGLTRTAFLDARPKSDMPAFAASCDISMVPLLTRMPGTMPSKFYEALAAGSIPCVAAGCEAAELAARHQAGVCYEPMNPQALAAALQQVLALGPAERGALRRNARTLALRFDRDRLAGFVEKTLTALVGGRPLPAVDW